MHAIYFATYEMSKEMLGGNKPGHHPIASASAASIATIISDGLMTPVDVVKQRLQVLVFYSRLSSSAAFPNLLAKHVKQIRPVQYCQGCLN